jgi:hypothetical protein
VSDRACLLIDDLAPCLRRLSELGQSIVGPPAQQVREMVLAFCQRRGWNVVGHDDFRRWSSELVRSDSRRWLILDPLLSAGEFGERALEFRISRQVDSQRASQRRRPNPLERIPDLGEIGIVDDGASTGRTLGHTTGLVHPHGGTLRRVVVCTATRRARESAEPWNRSVQWDVYVPGDFRIGHLRDGYPFLPFAGRPTHVSPIAGVNGADVEPRVSAADLPGSNWNILAMDRGVREALRDARTHIVAELSRAVGRAALVADLGLLATELTTPVQASDEPTGATLLT